MEKPPVTMIIKCMINLGGQRPKIGGNRPLIGPYFQHLYVMRCAIWYQTLKNGVLMVGQNAVLFRMRLNGFVRKVFLSIRLHGTETLI